MIVDATAIFWLSSLVVRLVTSQWPKGSFPVKYSTALCILRVWAHNPYDKIKDIQTKKCFDRCGTLAGAV